MSEETLIDRLKNWLAFLPIRLAYRIIWLAALTGHYIPCDVYEAMWQADLDLPPLKGF